MSYDWPLDKYEERRLRRAGGTQTGGSWVPGEESRDAFEQLALVRRPGFLPPQPPQLIALGEVDPSIAAVAILCLLLDLTAQRPFRYQRALNDLRNHPTRPRDHGEERCHSRLASELRAESQRISWRARWEPVTERASAGASG